MTAGSSGSLETHRGQIHEPPNWRAENVILAFVWVVLALALWLILTA
jgi:hypothetical protein